MPELSRAQICRSDPLCPIVRWICVPQGRSLGDWSTHNFGRPRRACRLAPPSRASTSGVPVHAAWMPSQLACHTSHPGGAVHSRVSPLPPLSARHQVKQGTTTSSSSTSSSSASSSSASSSTDRTRRADALGVSPRVAAPRRCRYSNPRKPTAANQAEADAGGVAAHPLPDAMAARLGPSAITTPRAHRGGQQRGQQQCVQSQASALFRPPQHASAADRECYASEEVHAPHGLRPGN